MKRDLSYTQVPKLKKQLLAQILKEMKIAHISQGEIGRRLDVPRTNVNMTLKMKTNATLDQLIRIANCVGLKIHLEVTN